MREFTFEMTQVSKCAVAKCAYNAKDACHAKAITVGDGARPACDTSFLGASHARNVAVLAGVGACKVADCRHNADLECTAERIEVGVKGAAATCLTYRARARS